VSHAFDRPGPDIHRATMAAYPTGVTLVTQGPPATVEAMTANSFTSVSLEPLLIMVSIRRGGRMCARLTPRAPFAVQILGAGQSDLAAAFARPDRPSGPDAASWLGGSTSARGNLLVPGTVAAFECEVETCHPGGDHLLYLGRVLTLHTADAPASPLLFHRGAFTQPHESLTLARDR